MASNNIGLFGTATRSATLQVIQMLGETHASEIAKVLGKSLSRIQAALDSLERAGVVIGVEEGKARRVRLNPRFPAQTELTALLARLGMLDTDLQHRLGQIRRRPRRQGKAI